MSKYISMKDLFKLDEKSKQVKADKKIEKQDYKQCKKESNKLGKEYKEDVKLSAFTGSRAGYTFTDSNLIIFQKGSNTNLLTYGAGNFSSHEFDCHCNHKKCNKTYIHKDLLILLQKARMHFGKPIMINSGYRCKKHNKAIGGAKKSRHVLGLAADLKPIGFKLSELIKYMEGAANGMGYYTTFVHVDVRKGSARWDMRSK